MNIFFFSSTFQVFLTRSSNSKSLRFRCVHCDAPQPPYLIAGFLTSIGVHWSGPMGTATTPWVELTPPRTPPAHRLLIAIRWKCIAMTKRPSRFINLEIAEIIKEAALDPAQETKNYWLTTRNLFIYNTIEIKNSGVSSA